MKWNRFTGILGTASIVGVLIIAITPLTNIVAAAYAVRDELQPAGAIVVLGTGVFRDGSLPYESQQRLLLGLRLYKEGMAPILVLSGPANPETPLPEATVRAHIAEELGIPETKILELRTVLTTRDEAQQTKRILEPFAVTTVLLVTDSMHMRRAKAVFQAAGLKVSAEPSDNLPAIADSPVPRLILFHDLLIQSAGFVYYRLVGYI